MTVGWCARVPRPGREPPSPGRSYRGMMKFRNTCTAVLAGAITFLGLAQVGRRRPGAGKFRARFRQFRLWLPGLSARHLAMRPRAVHRRFGHVGRWPGWAPVAAPGASFASTGSRRGASVSQVVFAEPLGWLGVRQFALGHVRRRPHMAKGGPRWPRTFAEQFGPLCLCISGELFARSRLIARARHCGWNGQS